MSSNQKPFNKSKYPI
jgi:SAM-dependent MidA family methyltransferase